MEGFILTYLRVRSEEYIFEVSGAWDGDVAQLVRASDRHAAETMHGALNLLLH